MEDPLDKITELLGGDLTVSPDTDAAWMPYHLYNYNGNQRVYNQQFTPLFLEHIFKVPLCQEIKRKTLLQSIQFSSPYSCNCKFW